MQETITLPTSTSSPVLARLRRSLPWATLLRWLLLALGPLAIFALFLLTVGADPIKTYRAMYFSALGDGFGLAEVLIRAAPFVLGGLATALPARTRLVNVGAEGQIALGALATTFAAMAIGNRFPAWVTLPALLVAGAAGGAVWAGIAGLLRTRLAVNETISTLLLNYVGALVVIFCVHTVLKDPESFNWPFSPPFADAARWVTIGNTRLHWGVIVAPIAALLVWYFLTRTHWGLHLRVVGGNPEAARRAGFNVERIQLLVFIAAGALAGMAGMLEVAGVEGRLRPTTGVGFGYVGFLAAWMVGQHPLGLIASSLLLAVLAVSGDALQITARLPASSVNILMAFVLIGILARVGKRKT